MSPKRTVRKVGKSLGRLAAHVTTPPAKLVRAAVAAGRTAAEEVIELRQTRPRRRARGPRALLLAEGDSWFDYPFFDTLEELEDGFGYRIESVAHKGDTVEDMAYSRTQLDTLYRKFRDLADSGLQPKAILLSGGGNDIAGDEFPVLLNHKNSGQPSLNENVLRGLFDERLRFAVIALATGVTAMSEHFFKKKIPMVIHGYDYPVPDGRGYVGAGFILPGPWLEPGFRKKGFADLAERVRIMKTLIDRYNAMLASVAGKSPLTHMRYLNLRGTLSNALPKAYRAWWNDELHPTEKGFVRVAAAFHSVLTKL